MITKLINIVNYIKYDQLALNVLLCLKLFEDFFKKGGDNQNKNNLLHNLFNYNALCVFSYALAVLFSNVPCRRTARQDRSQCATSAHLKVMAQPLNLKIAP